MQVSHLISNAIPYFHRHPQRRNTIKAIVYRSYGPPYVLKLEEMVTPTPGAEEILVRIKATTVTAEDPKHRAFKWPPMLWLPVGLMFGFRKPKITILGFEFSGIVESVGPKVNRFTLGDEVFGYTGLSFGAYAEFKILPASALLARKPVNLSFGEAAAIPNGALSALVYLRNKAHLLAGEKLLIYGASGSVGSAAVQLAKIIGAEVTAVCSQKNVELMRKLGADYVIDYTQQDFLDSALQYDVIFDTVGKTRFFRHRQALKPGGRYLMTEFGVRELLQSLLTWFTGGQRLLITASNMHWQQKDLEYLRELCENGHFKPVVDRCFLLEEAALAHDYVEQGHKIGNVVLRV